MALERIPLHVIMRNKFSLKTNIIVSSEYILAGLIIENEADDAKMIDAYYGSQVS